VTPRQRFHRLRLSNSRSNASTSEGGWESSCRTFARRLHTMINGDGQRTSGRNSTIPDNAAAGSRTVPVRMCTTKLRLKPTSKLAQSWMKNPAHLLQIRFLRMVSAPTTICVGARPSGRFTVRDFLRRGFSVASRVCATRKRRKRRAPATRASTTLNRYPGPQRLIRCQDFGIVQTTSAERRAAGGPARAPVVLSRCARRWPSTLLFLSFLARQNRLGW